MGKKPYDTGMELMSQISDADWPRNYSNILQNYLKHVVILQLEKA